MDRHNTHFISNCSKFSKDENSYKYDNFGNIIVESIDDLIYDKYVTIKKKENKLNLKNDNKSYNIIGHNNTNKTDNESIGKNKLINSKNNLLLKKNIILNFKKANFSSNENENNKNNKSLEYTNNIHNYIINDKNYSFINDTFQKPIIIYDEKIKNNKNINKIKYRYNNKKIDNNSKSLSKETSFKDNNYDNNNDCINKEKKEKNNNNQNITKLKYSTKEKKWVNLNNLEKNKKTKKNILKNKNIQNKTHININKSKSYNGPKNDYKSMNNNSNNYKVLINYTEIKRKRYTLKLRLNSNNTSIESINIENEGNNNIKKLKKEYVLFKPILPICYIVKNSNYKNRFIHTAKNKNYFSKKENYIISKKYLDKNIDSININNKKTEKIKTNQIFQKINLNKKNNIKHLKKALTPIVKNNKKKIINFNENIKDLSHNKRSYKDIRDNIRKKILSINKVKGNRNKKLTNNSFLKKTKKSSNKINRSYSRFLINNNTFRDKIPLLDINDINTSIIKKINKDKIIFVRNENNNKYHMIGFLKHKGNIDKCPICLEMMKNIKNNNINNDNRNIYENENIKIKYKRNNSENKKLLNKKIIDFCKKDEINKINLINNEKQYNIERNSILWEYSKSNKAKKTNIFKKYFSSYNIIKDKSLKKRKRNFIDYFSNNDSNIMDNYTFLLKNEFPIINSYFHKQK